MSKRFYAVQVGNDYSSDWGSTRKREAIVMAHQAARENPGKEIRISICTTDDDFCMREIVIREGSRTNRWLVGHQPKRPPEKESTMDTINNGTTNDAQTPSKEHVVVNLYKWVTGSGWSSGDSCEYDYDPEHQHTRDDLVDFVDDRLRLLLDHCFYREEREERLKACADDSISDTQYTMTVYAAHDDDDDYHYDERIAEYRVWMSDVAKRLLEAKKDD